MEKTFQISGEIIRKAIQAADAAQETFGRELKKAGQRVLDEVKRRNTFAVVLASRPYQNDELVNHDLPQMFTKMGVPVLTADSLRR